MSRMQTLKRCEAAFLPNSYRRSLTKRTDHQLDLAVSCNVWMAQGERGERLAKVARVFPDQDGIKVRWYLQHRPGRPCCINELHLSDRGGAVDLQSVSAMLRYQNLLTAKRCTARKSFGVDRECSGPQCMYYLVDSEGGSGLRTDEQ